MGYVGEYEISAAMTRMQRGDSASEKKEPSVHCLTCRIAADEIILIATMEVRTKFASEMITNIVCNVLR